MLLRQAAGAVLAFLRCHTLTRVGDAVGSWRQRLQLVEEGESSAEHLGCACPGGGMPTARRPGDGRPVFVIVAAVAIGLRVGSRHLVVTSFVSLALAIAGAA